MKIDSNDKAISVLLEMHKAHSLRNLLRYFDEIISYAIDSNKNILTNLLKKNLIQSLQEEVEYQQNIYNYQKSLNQNQIFDSKYRIVLLADSHGLPRPPFAGNIPFEKTYPYYLCFLLKSHLSSSKCPQLNARCLRARTIKNVLEILENWHIEKDSGVNFLIVQVGITECTPRIFKSYEDQTCISNLHNTDLGRMINEVMIKHKRQLIHYHPDRTWIPFAHFKKSIDQLVLLAEKKLFSSIIFINIIEPSDGQEYRNPGFKQNVRKYNTIFKNAAIKNDWIHLIDLNKIIWNNGGPYNLTIDGHHLTVKGNQLLVQELEALVMYKIILNENKYNLF